MIFLICIVCQLSPGIKADFLRFFEENRAFSSHFEQVTESAFLEPTRSSGELQVFQPGKFRMTYLKGEEKFIVCDGKICFEQDLLAETKTRTPLKDIAEEPLARILIFGDQIQDFFLIDRISEMTFRLRPRNEDAYHIEIVFAPHWQLRSIAYISNEGESTTLHLSNYQKVTDFPKNTFQVPLSDN